MKYCHGFIIALAYPLILIQALTLPKLNIQQPLIRQQSIESNDLSIPGDSSVKHCADPTNDLFHIERLDVLPNPPQRYLSFHSHALSLPANLVACGTYKENTDMKVSGQSCIIEIEGVFAESVGENPMFMLNATYDSIHSIDTVEKLCDHVDIVQDEAPVCPPRKGSATLSYSFFIHELMTPPVGSWSNVYFKGACN